MTYRTEFPDFPESDWPEMPEGFEDTSWHNDVCPNITCEALSLAIYIDYSDPKARETGENGERFTVYRLDGDHTITDDALTTDNWQEVLDLVARVRAAGPFHDVLDKLATNDGAILYWQTNKRRFEEAYNAGAILWIGELFVHPDAIEIEKGMLYVMPKPETKGT